MKLKCYITRGCPLGRSGVAGLLTLSSLLALLPVDALAYIDPGYGALLQQVLLSGLFGTLFLARKTIRRISIAAAGLLGGSRRSREHAQVSRAEEPATERARDQHLCTSIEAPPPL